MKITAYLQELSQDEIKENIAPDVYAKIKETDPTPLFRSYAIGHEGKSTGKFVGFGTLVKTWFKSAIKAIVEKLKIGTKIFSLHNADSSHEGRISIGEVVGKALKKWGETLYAIAVVYIKPEFRALNLDVASIEADILLPMENVDNIQIKDIDVKEITGIALGDSAKDKPGFAGATLIASLQEFQNTHFKKKSAEGEGEEMDLKAIMDAIKAGGYTLSEVFSGDQIKSDKFVKGIIDEEKGNEYSARKRIEGTHKTEKEAYESKLKEKDATIQTLTTGNLKMESKEVINNIIKERKLSDVKVKYINKDIDSFKPESKEKLTENINAFLDTKLDDFDKHAEIFGIKKEEKPDPNKDDLDDIQNPKDEPEEDELLDPEKNDFIPK